MLTRAQILTALPKLKPADLEAVSAMATHLLTNAPTGRKSGPATPLADAVFDALTQSIRATVPYAKLTPKLRQAYNRQLLGLTEFLDDHFVGWNKNKTAQLAFLRMLFVLVADDLRRRQIKPTIGVMINNMGRVPYAFDDAFPGYREAGMTNLITRNFQ
jgi:hypothetical protein